MGGIHPTCCPESCIGHADTVVIGEAEGLWQQILKDLGSRTLQPVYRHDIPPDPADSPIPRWELMNTPRYLFTNTLVIGRGCPWRCDFCYNSSDYVHALYRTKRISQILTEVESLGTRQVMFIDDNFMGSPSFARKLVEAMKPLDLTWHAAVSADIGQHDQLLDQMAEAGCKSLFIGFESINTYSIRECHKGQNRITDYDRTIAKIHDRGMMVNASLVFGFDHDTPTVFARTEEWLRRNRIATMTAHILTPYPGTRLYRRLIAENRITDFDLRHYNTAHAVFKPARMSARELERGYRSIYGQFYSWASILKRWPTDPTQVSAYLEFNLLYRKFGKITCHLGKIIGMRRLAEAATWVAYRKGHKLRHGWNASLRGDKRLNVGSDHGIETEAAACGGVL